MKETELKKHGLNKEMIKEINSESGLGPGPLMFFAFFIVGGLLIERINAPDTSLLESFAYTTLIFLSVVGSVFLHEYFQSLTFLRKHGITRKRAKKQYERFKQQNN